MRSKCSVPVLAALLAACSSAEVKNSAPVACTDGGVLEVSLVPGAGQYGWKGESLGASQLASTIKAHAGFCPVSEIRLLPGTVQMSIAHAIEIGGLASDLGAKASYVDAAGAVKAIQFVQ
jgi:hypothetical protein